MSALTNESRFDRAIALFDAANAMDPNGESVGGRSVPRELLYSQRLTHWVQRLRPDASEPLRLAARCQHLRRWESPRDRYPMDRAGYLKWRADLKQFHARESGKILREAGYDDATVTAVQDLNLKKNLKSDPDCQVLEDALCLVFLEFQFADLAARSTDEKMINALKKSWAKMSEAGRSEALKLPYPDHLKPLLQQALTA